MKKKLTALLAGMVLAASSMLGAAPPAAALSPGVAFAANNLPTWQTNGIVWAMAESNGVVYVGGTFTAIRPPGVAAGGAGTRSAVNFAAFDAYTGNPVNCSLSLTGNSATVRSMDVSPDGKTLYVGGYFSTVNGVATTKLAAINLPSCTVNTGFRPPAINSFVRAIEATPSGVYFGGDFKTVGSATRNRLAQVSANGSLQPWAPSADLPVRALHVPAGRNIVLAGGDFLTMNGADSKALAVLNNNTGANIRTYPNFFIPKTSVVKSIDSDATSFYIGNEGTGGGVFDGRVRLDLTTYNQVWRDTCLGATQAVSVIGSTLYAAHHAHDCSTMNAFTDGSRIHLSAQSINEPSPMYQWNPDTNDGQGEGIGPRALAHTTAGSGNVLWTGGEFTTVNGQAQQSLTRFGPGPGTLGPGTPQFVSAESRAAGQNTVRWQSTSDKDDSELTYRVYRNGSATPLATVTSSSRWWDLPQASFTDTTAAAGTTYTYRVQATDPAGHSGALSAQVQITTAASAAAYPALVRADGAITYWRLGDALAAAADSSNGDKMGLPNLGAKLSGTTSALRSDSNRAATFDGVDDMIYGQQRISAPTVFSAEAWFKTDTTTGGKILGFGNGQPRRKSDFTGYSNVYDRHVYMSDAGKLVFGTWSSGSAKVLTSAASYNDNAWHHLVATQGAAGMALYVDGVRVASNNISANQASIGSWRIGGDSVTSSWPTAPTSRHFKGAIDEFAVYPTALTPAQVAAHNQLGRR